LCALRRGFKAEAERISAQVRTGLGLTPRERLECEALAGGLGVDILSLDDLVASGAAPASIARLAEAEARFSAMTLCFGDRRLIVHNPAESPGRHANSLAHELSHVLLKHPAEPALDASGCRRWNGTVEEEADCLAAALLVPRDGALWWLGGGRSMSAGAMHFGVSERLFTWRANKTGVVIQLRNAGHRI